MGNAITRTYDIVDYTYDKYYPKHKWLQPVYVSSALMASHVGFQMIYSSTKCAVLPSNLYNFVFLFSTGANVGIQLWVSFLNGMTMIRLLPRHQFGLVQSHLFPKYFFLTTLFSFGSLSTFLGYNPIQGWKGDTLTIGSLLLGSFLLSVVNFTCFNIGSIKYNLKMHQIEKSAGEGITTVGKLMQESKVEQNPEYQEAKSKFYRFHSYSLGSNLVTFASSVATVYLLSTKKFFSF